MMDLGLRGTDLSVFAILNGFSQQGNGCFYGSRRELARRCGVTSLNTIDNALRTLINRGLVERFPLNVKGEDRIAYAVISDHVIDTQNLINRESTPTQKMSTPYSKNEQGGCSNNEHRKKSNNNKEKTFIPPTPQEVAAYAKEVGYKDPEGFAAYYVTYQNAAGWVTGKDNTPINNWKLNVLAWRNNHKDEVFEKPGRTAARRLTWEEYQKLND